MAEQTKTQTNNQVISWSQTKIFLYISLGLYIVTSSSNYIQSIITFYFLNIFTLPIIGIFSLIGSLSIFVIIFNFIFWYNTFQNSKKIYGFQKGMEVWRIALCVIIAPLATYFLFQSFIRFHKRLMTPKFNKFFNIYNLVWKVFIVSLVATFLIAPILAVSNLSYQSVITLIAVVNVVFSVISVVTHVITYMLYFEMDKIQTTDKINYQKYLNSKSL